MNTLRGVFPEPAPIPRRNFIKENMIHIKRMQGLVDNSTERNAPSDKRITFHEKEASSRLNAPDHRTMKLIHTTRKQLQNFARMSLTEKPKMISASTHKNILNKKCTKYKSKQCEKGCRMGVSNAKETLDKNRFKEIGIQTDEIDSASLVRENQNPSSKITQKSPPPRRHSVAKSPLPNQNSIEIKSPKLAGDGDKSRRKHDFSEEPRQHSDTTENKHDYVKENAQVFKHVTKPSTTKDPTMAPPTYQKGVVPKYIQERKEELQKKTQGTEGVDQCPEGYVILPENERKETLRMLNQSYTELISDLNMLPVRSDTLKIRNRKHEIEEQLKKLDEGIRVFNRPKVFVKINA